MKIVGIVKSSLIDYPGAISAVIFTFGCNFRCRFCHNPNLVVDKVRNLVIHEEKEILDFLEKRKGLLDGVVITGGEPLINKDIVGIIRKIKAMGFLVKIDTNGTNPKALRQLITEKMVDFIAMDIKNSLDKYTKTVGANVDTISINESIEIIKSSKLPYEFRSTILPRLHSEKDFHAMGEMLRGANKFVVQGFRPGTTLDKDFENERSFTSTELQDIAKIFEGYVKTVEVRENL